MYDTDEDVAIETDSDDDQTDVIDTEQFGVATRLGVTTRADLDALLEAAAVTFAGAKRAADPRQALFEAVSWDGCELFNTVGVSTTNPEILVSLGKTPQPLHGAGFFAIPNAKRRTPEQLAQYLLARWHELGQLTLLDLDIIAEALTMSPEEAAAFAVRAVRLLNTEQIQSLLADMQLRADLAEEESRQRPARRLLTDRTSTLTIDR